MTDIIGGLVTSQMNWMNNQEAFRQQKELQRDAQNYNKMMFNLANQYNSPFQQMMRFKSAGLNPNLIYGQMANTASAPTMGSPSAPSPAQAAPMSSLETAQLGLLKAQKESMEIDNTLKRQDFDIKDWQYTQDKMWQDFERSANLELLQEKGLAVAIGNWLNGAVPRDADDPNSHNGFADVYRKMKPEIEAFRNDLKDQWKLDEYDRRYMDRCFDDVCNNDKESFKYNVNKLRSQSAVLKALSENEWMQFVDYLTDKLMGLAQSGVGMYASIKMARKPSKVVNVLNNGPF